MKIYIGIMIGVVLSSSAWYWYSNRVAECQFARGVASSGINMLIHKNEFLKNHFWIFGEADYFACAIIGEDLATPYQ